jgi:LysM repeat protein
MPKDLKDFPRPPSDNGRGLVGSASTGWSGGKEGYDFWIGELEVLGVKWVKVLDDHGDSLSLCTKLLEAGIFPIVRIIRRDPPPNDSPEPNPGHINATEEEVIRRLIAAGVRYFETNNEPNLATEWKNEAMPGDNVETAKLVALNWLFDARFILAAGGYPGLPAISVGGSMDLMGALVALGRQDILLEGCWIALHNYCQNRPLDFPDDSINRIGQTMTAEQYDQNVYTQWAWWRASLKRADSINEVNALRAAGKSPTQTIQQDHACFREFEYYNSLAMKYLGRSIPIISTEGGYIVGHREDARYPAITPDSQRDLTVALFDYMQRQAPDYYFAAMPSQLVESEDMESAAWYSSFWKRVLAKGSDGMSGISTIPVPGAALGDRLPVIDAVKAMPNLARRMPGMQPAPPSQAPVTAPAHKTAPLKYVVMEGDTLPKIAKQFGTTWKDVATLNQLSMLDSIEPGQTLLIPRPADVAQVSASMPSEAVAPPSARPGLSVLFPDSEEETTAEPLSAPTPIQPPLPFTPVEASEPIVPPPPPTFEPPLPAAPVEAPQSFVPPTPPSAFQPAEPESAPPPPPVFESPKPPQPAAFEPPTAVAPPSKPVLAPPPKFPDLATAPLELEWDWRLDALGVMVQLASVARGQEYWKLVQAVYQSPDEAGGNHHIYYTVLDESRQPLPNQRVWQGWSDDKTDASTDEKGETNIPLWASYAPDRGEYGPYYAWVDGLPSDGVVGMGLPLKRHVNFLLTWQRTVA